MGWIVVILGLMIPLVAVILDSQLGRALAGRLERSSAPPDESVTRRIAALESEVERLGLEVQRLEEESTFLHRLLESKPDPQRGLPPADQSA